MKKIKSLSPLLIGLFIISVLFSFNVLEERNKLDYKCIVQLTNYTGEGAYVVVSLINPKGDYEETLYMLGEDDVWYDYFKGWWSFWQKDKINIDAVTGESIIGGDRKIVNLKLDPSKMGMGYKIRFETAVENQNYHMSDAEVSFDKKALKTKVLGSGYIRYVRFIPTK